MGELPSGRLTLLFTDIEGSTRLVSGLGEAYGSILDEHHRLVRDAIAAHRGVEVSTTGDSFFVVFLDALDATLAAAAIQRALASHAWPPGASVRVRMGLHVGHTVLVGREYVGLDVNRASRVADAANGGQVLLSEQAELAIRDRLPAGLVTLDLGRHRLKDVGPEHLWRLHVDGLPDDPRRPRSIEANPTNLPIEPTALVDRERECRELLDLVASSRIVTVTGPGGAGKTRVALRVAREAIPSFPDGVFHLDLATAGEVEVALRGIAEVLGLPPSAAESPLDQLIAHARRRRVLLVLDTADRVLRLGAALGAVAAASSTIAFLVTSRSPLRVAAEHEYQLGPLASHASRGADPGPAVALFLERARAVRPDLAVGADDLATIAEICDRVDGLPLAIELAAARVKVLSPAAILARLEHLLPVLTGGATDAPARQRTLRDTIAWSYGLLDAGEQAVLQRLAVFVSSFDLSGAEAIVGPHPDVLGALEHLVDRSLLTVTPTAAEPRFRLLGAIREFALEMLDASDAAAAVREAHARHLLDVVETMTAAIGSTGEAAALDALERVMDDARAALAWAIDEPVDPARADLAIRLVGRLGRYWWLRGRVREGSAWLERALQHGESAPPAVRAAALYWAGILLDDRGDPGGADSRLTAALTIQREGGDEPAAARTLNSLGVVALSLGDAERAERLLRESLAIKERRGLERERATTLHNLAAVAVGRQRYGEAIALYEKALGYDARVGAHGAEAFSRIGLGAVRIMAGDDARGAAEVRAALPQLADLGAVDALADALDALGEAEAHEGRPDRAARLLLAASELRARESVAQRPPDAARAAGVLAGVVGRLTPGELEAARTDARAMDVAAAVAYAVMA